LQREDPAEGLTASEKRALFRQYALQRESEQQASPKDIQRGVAQLLEAKPPKERYRDGEIVTRKGERFVKVSASSDPGPGCQIGGVLGWRTKLGRQGLGLRKMNREEADRVCISNKERSHIRKASGPSGCRDGYVFENKWSQHTPQSSRCLPPNSLASKEQVKHS